jgi:hypothetical protein
MKTLRMLETGIYLCRRYTGVIELTGASLVTPLFARNGDLLPPNSAEMM